jgi:opacity protein-like surface antigen
MYQKLKTSTKVITGGAAVADVKKKPYAVHFTIGVGAEYNIWGSWVAELSYRFALPAKWKKLGKELNTLGTTAKQNTHYFLLGLKYTIV